MFGIANSILKIRVDKVQQSRPLVTPLEAAVVSAFSDSRFSSWSAEYASLAIFVLSRAKQLSGYHQADIRKAYEKWAAGQNSGFEPAASTQSIGQVTHHILFGKLIALDQLNDCSSANMMDLSISLASTRDLLPYTLEVIYCAVSKLCEAQRDLYQAAVEARENATSKIKQIDHIFVKMGFTKYKAKYRNLGAQILAKDSKFCDLDHHTLMIETEKWGKRANRHKKTTNAQFEQQQIASILDHIMDQNMSSNLSLLPLHQQAETAILLKSEPELCQFPVQLIYEAILQVKDDFKERSSVLSLISTCFERCRFTHKDIRGLSLGLEVLVLDCHIEKQHSEEILTKAFRQWIKSKVMQSMNMGADAKELLGSAILEIVKSGDLPFAMSIDKLERTKYALSVRNHPLLLTWSLQEIHRALCTIYGPGICADDSSYQLLSRIDNVMAAKKFIYKPGRKRIGCYILQKEVNEAPEIDIESSLVSWSKITKYILCDSVVQDLTILQKWIEQNATIPLVCDTPEDSKIHFALDVQKSPEFVDFPFHVIHQVVQVCCKRGFGDKEWSAIHDELVLECIKFEEKANLDLEVIAAFLKESEPALSVFSLKKLKQKVGLLANALFIKQAFTEKAIYTIDEDWSADHERLFKQVEQQIQLNIRKKNIETWSKTMCRMMKGAVPFKDIFSRLHRMRSELDAENALLTLNAGEDVPEGEDGFDVENDDRGRLEDVTQPNVDTNQISQGEAFSVTRLPLRDAISAFNLAKFEGPETRCGSCGKLDFASVMTPYSIEMHACLISLPEVQTTLEYLCDLTDSQKLLCSACHTSISDMKEPLFCVGEASLFQPIPEAIQKLSDLESNLVSLGIAFGIIKELRIQKQKGIKGGMVCIPVQRDVTKTLPRTLDETDTIHIDLKRKLSYDHSHKSGTIRMVIVDDALQLLKCTPLYNRPDIVYRSLEEYDAANTPHDQGNLETENDTDETPEECPAQAAHTDIMGNALVADFVGCYADESGTAENAVPVATCLIPEKSANELRQTVLAVAPAEGGKPMKMFKEPHGEEQCWPKLFAGHPRTYSELSQFAIHKYELMNSDRRFANCIENIFYKMSMHECLSVMRESNLSLNKAVAGRVTAAEMLDPLTTDYLCAHDLGHATIKAIRSSPDFKQNCKRDLFAMIRQLGPPTFFLTLSAADTRWKELIGILYRIKTGDEFNDAVFAEMSSLERSQLIAGDPVTCARYYNRRIQLFLQKVIFKSTTIGEVTDYAGIDEFQARGTPHTHLMVWCENAPKYGMDPKEDVIRYYDQFVSTNTSLLAPEYAELQRHKHTHRCGGKKGTCSFGFPKPPMPSTDILEPIMEGEIAEEKLSKAKTDWKSIKNSMRALNQLIGYDAYDAVLRSSMPSSTKFYEDLGLTIHDYKLAIRTSISRTTFFFKREPIDIMINPFNKDILENWEANMDLQPVVHAYQTAMSIASYIMKTQKGISNLLRRILSESFPNTGQMIRALGKACISATETCAQEAVYHVLGLPLVRSTRQVKFIPTTKTQQRHRVAKTKKELEALAPDDVDIFKKGVVEKYMERNGEYEDLCFADFVACYTPEGSGISGTLLKQRKRPMIIRYVNYRRTTQFEDYCREHVMLYSPWRNALDEPPDGSSWEECFTSRNDIIKSNKEKYCSVNEEQWNADMETAFKSMQEGMDAETTASEGERSHSEADVYITDDNETQEPQNRTEASFALNTTRFIGPEDFSDKVAALNTKQFQFFKHVMYNVTRFPDAALNVFLTGGGGVGKSVVIDRVTQAITMFFNHNSECAINTVRAKVFVQTRSIGSALFSRERVRGWHALSPNS